MSIKPIFIIGVEHSGTTILYKMLSRHPEVCWFSQFSLRGGEIPCRKKLPFYKIINKLGRNIFGTSWKKEFGISKKIIPTPAEPHGIWEYLIPNKKSFFDESNFDEKKAQLARKFFADECESWGKERLTVKLPRLSRAVLLLNKIFPDALFVNIVRDGRAVAFSNREKFSRSPLGESVALERSAELWRDVVTYTNESKKTIGDRMFTLKYEDLCSDVRGWASKILDFLELSKEEDFLSKLPPDLSVTNQKWFNDCAKEDMDFLNKTLGTALEENGYD